jgi:hypothetical protein
MARRSAGGESGKKRKLRTDVQISTYDGLCIASDKVARLT